MRNIVGALFVVLVACGGPGGLDCVCPSGEACSLGQCAADGGGATGGGRASGDYDAGAAVDVDGGVACPMNCPETFSCEAGVCVGTLRQGLVLNQRLSKVSGTLLVNGVAPKRDAALCAANPTMELGRVYFGVSSHSFTCENTVDGFDWSLTLIPGVYQVKVRSEEHWYGAQMVLEEFVVDGEVSGLALDVAFVTVSGRVTVNGAAPNQDAAWCASNPDASLGDVVFMLQHPSGSEALFRYHFTCANTNGGFSWSLPLAAGRYRVQVTGAEARGGLQPFAAIVYDELIVDGPVADVVVDQAVATLSGIITIDGSAPMRSTSYCNNSNNLYDAIGQLEFVEPRRNVRFTYVFTCFNTMTTGFTWSAQLPAGDYQVTLLRGEYSSGAKVNLVNYRYSVHEALEVRGDQPAVVFNQSTQRYLVSGTVQAEGVALSRDAAFCQRPENANRRLGYVVFGAPMLTNPLSYGFTCANTEAGFAWSMELPPGRYDIVLARDEATAEAGVNLMDAIDEFQSGFVVEGPRSDVTLNQVGHRVSGTLLVDGVRPTRDAAYCARSENAKQVIASMSLVNQETRALQVYRFRCDNTTSGDFDWSLRLPSRTYRVWSFPSAESVAAGVNIGEDVRFSAPLVLDRDISGVVLNRLSTAQVSGRLTVNGAPPHRDEDFCREPANADYVIASLDFSGGYPPRSRYEFTCANTAAGFDWSVMLDPGISYAVTTYGSPKVGLMSGSLYEGLVIR